MERYVWLYLETMETEAFFDMIKPYEEPDRLSHVIHDDIERLHGIESALFGILALQVCDKGRQNDEN